MAEILRKKLQVLFIVLISTNTFQIHGFINNGSKQLQQQHLTPSTPLSPSSSPTELFVAGHYVQGDNGNKNKEDSSYFWDDFKTHRGEVVNPYSVLKVQRTASREEIKKSYYKLSKRYHPDGVRHRNILPGKCNNLDDVREHWERINLSYFILKDDKLRKKFNRHEVISDPGAAAQRAAVNAVGEGVKGIGKGIFNIGAFAINQMINNNEMSKSNNSRD